MSNRVKAIGLPLLVLAVVGIAACGDASTTVNTSGDANGIRVTGRGEVTAKPDTGFFTVGIEATARTVADARDDAADAANDLVESIRGNDVDAEDIKTTGLSIFPEYSYPGDGKQPTVTGYRVATSVTVTVRDLDRFSRIVDDAVAAGSDAVRLSGIWFDIEDTAALLQQAREIAMEDARDKAGQLAELAEVDLGEPLAISETTSTSPPSVHGEERDDAGGDSPIPIEPGTGTVTVTVDVRWSIR